MVHIATNSIVNVSILTAAQAHSADGKPRMSLQGFIRRDTTGKGKKQVVSVHEFSCLRPVRNGITAGKYVIEGSAVFLCDDVSSKSHVANGVKYERHNARLLSVSDGCKLTRIPDACGTANMPF